MASFDRESALKTAEKALRQGRIDAAISEYVRIVEAQARDWNSANALGDLYVRASQIDKAVAQYTRIADHSHGMSADRGQVIEVPDPGSARAGLRKGTVRT